MPLIRWSPAPAHPRPESPIELQAKASAGLPIRRQGLTEGETEFIHILLARDRSSSKTPDDRPSSPPPRLNLTRHERALLDATGSAAAGNRRPRNEPRVDLPHHAFAERMATPRLTHVAARAVDAPRFVGTPLHGQFEAVIQAGKRLREEDFSPDFHRAARSVEHLAQDFLRQAAVRPSHLRNIPEIDLAVGQVKSMLVYVRESLQQQLDLLLAQQIRTDPAIRAEARQQHAVMMSQYFNATQAAGGSSSVELFRRADKSIAYAFKTASGESDSVLVAPGGGALREAMCAVAGREIQRQTGLDLGFPDASLAFIAGRAGALVDGLPGECLDPDALITRSALSPQECVDTQIRGDAIAGRIAPAQLQKVLLANLATGNLDVKWGNVIVDDAGHCRPLDGGASFPTAAAIARAATSGVSPGLLGLLPFSTDPGASASPMDPELTAAMLRVDPDRYAAALQSARTELTAKMKDLVSGERSRQSFDVDRLLTEADIARGVASLRLMQQILRESPQLTMGEFADAFGSRLETLSTPIERQTYEQLHQAEPRLARRDRAEFLRRHEQACADAALASRQA